MTLIGIPLISAAVFDFVRIIIPRAKFTGVSNQQKARRPYLLQGHTFERPSVWATAIYLVKRYRNYSM